jgi:hypothetical protein
VIVSEHGFTPITKKLPNKIVDRRLQTQFLLPGWLQSNSDAEAVIMPGAGTKEIYLKNRKSQDWLDPPRLLSDVKPAMDSLLLSLEVQTATAAILVRQYPGERFEGVTEDDQWWVFDFKDYDSRIKDNRAFLSALRPLPSLTSSFELGDYLVTGLRNQYSRETAPDIKLVNKPGFYYEDDPEKYAHHGSFYANDCIVSFWVGGPGLGRLIGESHVFDQTASTLDLVPMVTYLLGIQPPTGLDGSNPLSGLVKAFNP